MAPYAFNNNMIDMIRNSRQRTYVREGSESSMSSSTSTNLSSSTHSRNSNLSGSTHSSSSYSEQIVGNRKRTDTDSSLSSRGEADSTAATRPRRRSHRPRGCRGGRKNRKKNQQNQVPTEISGESNTHSPSMSNMQTNNNPMATVDTNREQRSPPRVMLPNDPRNLASKTTMQKRTTIDSQASSLHPHAPAFVNSQATTAMQSHENRNMHQNNQYAPPATFATRALTAASSVSAQSRAPLPNRAPSVKSPSPYLSAATSDMDVDAPVFDLTYSSSADSCTAPNYDDNGNPVQPATLSGNILPPPPPPNGMDSGRRTMNGPNPYALTSNNQATNGSFGSAATQNAHSYKKTQSEQLSASASMGSSNGCFNMKDVPSHAGYYSYANSDVHDLRASFNDDHSLATNDDANATTTIVVGDSLFVISPRSFLTGAKQNQAPTAFVW
eukprot:CAMPEP_0172442436 /NCGR_PEP_ID=MMETSP1065-20121228/2854_1 /TAXON_ID=265537 /ORGANISM="Amphiprora paludosa, Strain CCMP125" /LENGTH=440 /DNA_ID=CAMNT_0013192279 /DNA_START=141 /DNA_END=1463 /DNA_ORIENTATION=-